MVKMYDWRCGGLRSFLGEEVKNLLFNILRVLMDDR